MEAEDVVRIIQLFADHDIEVWVDGGWGVDVLLGEQTRQHADLDIVVQQKDVPLLRELLEKRGFKDVERQDTSPWNFSLGDDRGRLVDVHAIVFDPQGNGLYGPVEKGVMYPAGSLRGVGRIAGRKVRCITAEYLVKFHTDYELDENDFKDVAALCERFGIEYPEEYRRPGDSNQNDNIARR
jgi:lincosamide nucleotidyltransferase A/C/D/E